MKMKREIYEGLKIRRKAWKEIEIKVLNVIKKKIILVFLNDLRRDAKDFAEWESLCLKFDSFSFFDNSTKRKLEFVFGKPENFNYFIFWELVVGE